MIVQIEEKATQLKDDSSRTDILKEMTPAIFLMLVLRIRSYALNICIIYKAILWLGYPRSGNINVIYK